MLGFSPMLFLQQREEAAADLEEILAVSAGTEVFQAQHACIEIARAFRIDDRENGGHAGSAHR